VCWRRRFPFEVWAARRALYLTDARDAIDKVLAYTKPGRQAFFAESIVQDAVIRNLEIFGEAVKNVTQETRARYQDIPWAEIAGLRDRLIHAYFHVDLNVAWDVVENDLQPLREKLATILDQG
jgi:uncharacterized protein with HEPN domain